ncbi:MAG: sulfotransferase domain-containing protein [Flavobacteriales bacterium]
MYTAQKKIIWLTSYPKSGNTWMRLFLHALHTGSSELQNLDEIEATNGIASSRALIDSNLGVYTSDMPDLDVQKARSEAYKYWSSTLKEDVIVKVHDAAFHRGIITFPREVTRKVIFIVRNPFDVVDSYANHMGCDIKAAVWMLCDGNNMLAKSKGRLTSQVAQYMGSWSDFYNSWKNLYRDDMLVVRFEDMKHDSLNTFRKVVDTLGWVKTDDDILKAIEASKFDKVKSLESNKGFREKPPKTEAFFRKGQTGGWSNEISAEQAQILVDRHFYTLLELGYIDKNGKILV